MDFEGCVWGVAGWLATEDGFHVGEDEGGDVPEFEFGGEAFPLAGGFTDDPESFFSELGGGGGGEGDKEGVGGFGEVVEHDGVFAGGEWGQA